VSQLNTLNRCLQSEVAKNQISDVAIALVVEEQRTYTGNRLRGGRIRCHDCESQGIPITDTHFNGCPLKPNPLNPTFDQLQKTVPAKGDCKTDDWKTVDDPDEDRKKLKLEPIPVCDSLHHKVEARHACLCCHLEYETGETKPLTAGHGAAWFPSVEGTRLAHKQWYCQLFSCNIDRLHSAQVHSVEPL
jgi:hypothetical protein